MTERMAREREEQRRQLELSNIQLEGLEGKLRKSREEYVRLARGVAVCESEGTGVKQKVQRNGQVNS